MSNLIFEAKMNRIRAHSMFPQSIKIFEDLVVFRKRRWFVVDETTITYNHIAQANLKSGIFFSTLEITTTGGADNPSVPYIKNKDAVRAQRIIEQKIYQIHATSDVKDNFKAEVASEISNVEKSINRLKELKMKGQITDKEFTKKKKEIIKLVG